MQEQIVFVDQLNIKMGSVLILEDLTFSINRAECVAIVGANGSGKTTLIKALCGFIPYSNGILKIADLTYKDTAEAIKLRQLIGYAPDSPPVYMHDTVYSFLQFIGRMRKLSKQQLAQQIDHCLDICNLQQYAHTKIYTLSKGTQQRINLAQAILHAPEILILDEPTNALDMQETTSFCQYLKQLQTTGVTIIVASHLYNDLIPNCSYMLRAQNRTVSKILLPNLNEKSMQYHAQWDYST